MPRCRGMAGGPLSLQQTLMETLICAELCLGTGDPKTVRYGHDPKGDDRLYQLKSLF